MTRLWGQVRAADISRPLSPKTDAATISAKYLYDIYRGYIYIAVRACVDSEGHTIKPLERKYM